jgi:hypothetical protein
MLGCVIRVVGDVESKPGTWRRGAKGSAFCLQVPSEAHDDRWYSYVVTAHHVIDAQPKPELLFPDSRRPGTLHPPIQTSGPDWIQPVDSVDLAVLPFDRPEGIWINTLRVGFHLYETLPGDALLAMPFHYVGLLEPLDRAMARSGTLGAVYQNGIAHRDGYEYAAHLGDCRTYAGFSGSPCFVEITFPSLTPQDPIVPAPAELGPLGRLRHLHLLCGMVTWHLERGIDSPEASAFGVVVMLTSDEIWRALMSPELVRERRRLDDSPSTGSTSGFVLGAQEGAWQSFSQGQTP